MSRQDRYKDLAADEDPYAAFDREPRVIRTRNEGYSTRSMIGALLALTVIIAAVLYVVQKTTSSMGAGPSATGASVPSSTGQGSGRTR
jgi:hypothetical protein